jgi:hypothetical protein
LRTGTGWEHGRIVDARMGLWIPNRRDFLKDHIPWRRMPRFRLFSGNTQKYKDKQFLWAFVQAIQIKPRPAAIWDAT